MEATYGRSCYCLLHSHTSLFNCLFYFLLKFLFLSFRVKRVNFSSKLLCTLPGDTSSDCVKAAVLVQMASKPFEPPKRVRLVCILSVYYLWGSHQAKFGWLEWLSKIFFDATLCAESEADIKELLKNIENEKLGLSIN